MEDNMRTGLVVGVMVFPPDKCGHFPGMLTDSLFIECRQSPGYLAHTQTSLLQQLMASQMNCSLRARQYKSSVSLKSSPTDYVALNILRGFCKHMVPAEKSLFEHRRKNALADEKILIMQRKVKFFLLYHNVPKLFGIYGSDYVCIPSDAFTLIKTLWQQFPLIKCTSVNEITWASDWRDDNCVCISRLIR